MDSFELHNFLLQFDARAAATITLVHDSCPAGFDIVERIIPGHFFCQCNLQDVNILNCNRSTQDILLQVRVQCMPVVNGLQVVLQCQFSILITVYSPSHKSLLNSTS